MATLPLIRSTVPGIYQVCTTANTDYVITVPTTATGCVLWFETSTSSSTPVVGRIGLDQANTAVTSITNADTVLGYHPPMAVEYAFRSPTQGTVNKVWTRTIQDGFLHVACATAGAVVRGMWLYATDETS